MRDVRGLRSRHVARDAAIVGLLPASLLVRHAAPQFLVTSQAGVAKVFDSPLGSYLLMRIVATDAAHFTSRATLKAQTFVHLLDMVHSLAVVFDVGSSDVYRPELLERQTWPEIIQSTAAPQH